MTSLYFLRHNGTKQQKSHPPKAQTNKATASEWLPTEYFMVVSIKTWQQGHFSIIGLSEKVKGPSLRKFCLFCAFREAPCICVVLVFFCIADFNRVTGGDLTEESLPFVFEIFTLVTVR